MSSKAFETWLFGRWGGLTRTAAAFLRDAVWPEGAFCCACERVSDGQPLCPACRQALRSDGFLFSWDLAEPVPGLTAWGLRPHTGIHRRLVLKLKYNAEARAAGVLADLVLPVPPNISFSPDTVVTWVTMPESRRRERCIDHSRLLAEAIAERLSLPCRQLLRRRETRQKRQAALSRSAREANLVGAFEPLETVSFPVLLVDDVRTTGTTLARCAEALRSAGAERISAVTVTWADQGK